MDETNLKKEINKCLSQERSKRQEIEKELEELKNQDKLWRSDFPVGWTETHKRMKKKIEKLEKELTILTQERDVEIKRAREAERELERLKSLKSKFQGASIESAVLTERESCAKIADDLSKAGVEINAVGHAHNLATMAVSSAIRSRTQRKQ